MCAHTSTLVAHRLSALARLRRIIRLAMMAAVAEALSKSGRRSGTMRSRLLVMVSTFYHDLIMMCLW